MTYQHKKIVIALLSAFSFNNAIAEESTQRTNADANTLDEVKVTAANDGENRLLREAYAGGQIATGGS